MKEITDLTDEEADWVNGHVATLEGLDVPLDAVALDEFLVRSRKGGARLSGTGMSGAEPGGAVRGDARRATDAGPVVNLVGAAVGQLLVERLDLRWVNVTDKRGTRLGLYGDAKKTVVFPLDAVARRWDGGSTSLAQYVAETVATIQKLRADRAS